MFAAPGFHHLHQTSVDPDAAIDFHVRQFPPSQQTSWPGEGVTFLAESYTLGDTRAVMIEGPSREALELAEVA